MTAAEPLPSSAELIAATRCLSAALLRLSEQIGLGPDRADLTEVGDACDQLIALGRSYPAYELFIQAGLVGLTGEQAAACRELHTWRRVRDAAAGLTAAALRVLPPELSRQ